MKNSCDVTKSIFLMWKLFLFQLTVVTTLFLGCKKEHLIIDQDNPAISTRGDGGEGDSLTTAQLIDLLGISCIPDSVIGLGGCDTVLVSDTVVISLPDYPGCSFTVEYKSYSCRFPYYVGIFLADFQIISHNCPAFIAAINSAYNAGEAAMNEFIGDFDFSVASQIKFSILNSLPPYSYDCDYMLRLRLYQYTRVSCFKNCRITYPDGSISNQKVACGSGCCVEITEACSDNGSWSIGIYSYPEYPYCDGPLLYDDDSLPILCSSQTECTIACAGYY